MRARARHALGLRSRAAAAVLLAGILSARAALGTEAPTPVFAGTRSWQMSAGGGALLPTEVQAHLRTSTNTSAAFYADATWPGPFLEYGAYVRGVRLVSTPTGGTATLATVGGQAKYELRPASWCVVRAGVLAGLHDLRTDTVSDALGLDLGATLEWAIRVLARTRVRLSIQGTSMVVGGTPNDALLVTFRPTAMILVGVEYVARE